MSSDFLCMGIESSCDDSSVALLNSQYQVQTLLTESHIKCLEPFKGVMPEVVSREHVRYLPILIDKINQTIKLEKIDLIAYTAGPGLAGSLLVGANLAHSLSLILNKPLIPVHHIAGHQLAYLIEEPALLFPCLSLVVSGGHTQLLLLKSPLHYTILGQTRDDAAGEAFDKIAKYIGLGYPGGPALASCASRGNPLAHRFSIPMFSSETLDFSFSGLKTQAIRVWDKQELSLEDFCASVEYTIVSTLVLKTKQALKKHPMIKSLLLSGGVACNLTLRTTLTDFASKKGLQIHIPSSYFCADNAAMIAAAGIYRWIHHPTAQPYTSPLIRPNWSIEAYSCL
jgi:N6-L-threonylcarbamoyladenine synthase